MPPKKKDAKVIPIRLNEAENAHVTEELAKLKAATGIEFSAGAYVKHATLEHASLRKLESLVKASACKRGSAGTLLSQIIAEAGR